MAPENPDPSGPVQPLPRIALASYLLLIALTLAWEGWLAPARSPGFWLTVKLVPLLLPLAGMLQARLRSALWASLLLMLYLTEGLVLLWTERLHGFAWSSTLPWALAETVLCLVFILSASFHIRKQRAAGASLAR